MEENNKTQAEALLANSVERFLAALIDSFIVVLLSAAGIGIILGVAYFLTKDSLPFFEGQSLGKRLLKIKVIDTDTSKPIVNRYDTCAIRNVSLLIPIFQFVDALMVFSSDRRRFGDQWARTIVVKEI